MPSNRLALFFERKPRHSKSTSQLTNQLDPSEILKQPVAIQSRVPKSERLPVASHAYHSAEVLPKHSAIKSSTPIPRPNTTYRSSTTPSLQPPDELYLKTIRRRSASARLEEMRIEHEQHQKYDPELEMTLAIASAMPPLHFDQPPSYFLPDSDLQTASLVQSWPQPSTGQTEFSDHRSRMTVSGFENKNLFLEKSLRLQIDDTIAQYASIEVTQPTPTEPSHEIIPIVSPINEIDRIYLERRKNKKRQDHKTSAR